jgi:hypothetical protein
MQEDMATFTLSSQNAETILAPSGRPVVTTLNGGAPELLEPLVKKTKRTPSTLESEVGDFDSLVNAALRRASHRRRR